MFGEINFCHLLKGNKSWKNIKIFSIIVTFYSYCICSPFSLYLIEKFVEITFNHAMTILYLIMTGDFPVNIACDRKIIRMTVKLCSIKSDIS